ncbi:MAG: phosphoribosylanthranilate isomerase [Pararhodobacter sp.]|nr:phosphoribosylanthranilate isomerase [Pararhodobacter sp.]
MTGQSGARIKVCGLTAPDDMDVLARAGVAYAGLNFYPPSPRALSVSQARAIALAAPAGLARVGLFVNADDALIDAVLADVPLDFLQLHGNESPARLAALRARHGLPLIRAVGVAGPSDLPALDRFAQVADMLLVDAKPAPDAALPGGNGLAFDWRLIAGRRWPVPWLLAGGLTPRNVAEAIRLTGARQLDVSSGVESAPGTKDAGLIAAFVAAAQAGPVPAV